MLEWYAYFLYRICGVEGLEEMPCRMGFVDVDLGVVEMLQHVDLPLMHVLRPLRVSQILQDTID